MRRASVVTAAIAVVLLTAVPAGAADTSVLVLRAGDRSLADLLATAVPRDGSAGAALLSHTEDLDEVLAAVREDPELRVLVAPFTGAAEFGAALPSQTWIVSEGPDGLGAAVLIVPSGGVRAMTSDSTRRDGVVVVEDLPPTMRALAGLPEGGGGGSVIRVTDGPPPLDLEVRRAANRRMSVPIQTAAGLYVTFAGLFGVALLIARRRVPPWLSSLGAWTAIAVVPLAVSLLFAGHLGTLTYGTVLPAVIGGTVAGCLGSALVARRWGTMAALEALGVATIALFVLEAALGWTAALTTFLGGSQLDGGRFYGLPNVDIGLLLGAGVFVAHRLRRIWPGAVLLAALALFAGLPFAGANLGAGVTLAAAAGLWWGLRGEQGAGRTVVAALVGAAAGLATVLLLNRLLPGPPTHIAAFVADRGDGIPATVLQRLETGLRLIARNPFAIVPVIGVPVTLLAVLRPAEPVRASFRQHPGWREALLTILWGSAVAYVANDTGAAALGLGFGTALGGLLFVSLRDRPWIMGAT